YPSAGLNTDTPSGNPDQLLSVQSVVVDPRDRLWALDTGSVKLGPIAGQEWPKLVGIDLKTDQVFKVIRFPPEVVHKNTYLNDVRFDLRRGGDGLAFITDSGAGGLIVVDLASGRSWRKLHGHESVMADPAFSASLEGQPVMIRPPGQEPKPFRVQSDGIALSADGSRLFYCPLSSRALYSVSVDALADEKLPDAEVLKTLRKEERQFASDGLESDAQGRVYLTDWEHNAVHVRDAGGSLGTLVSDPRLWWPDTLALSADGYLYITANQLHRQAQFHGGKDLRQKPYHLFRVKVDATPVALTR
ncbi:MAG TPA: L-dopachrome tautomerase-related protein, partial [Myxococcus sp.]|nr:L-dopachrome tautomerase-related protein [Myxococcus sp.]